SIPAGGIELAAVGTIWAVWRMALARESDVLNRRRPQLDSWQACFQGRCGIPGYQIQRFWRSRLHAFRHFWSGQQSGAEPRRRELHGPNGQQSESGKKLANG